jgi:class 3 adenylate cyclase
MIQLTVVRRLSTAQLAPKADRTAQAAQHSLDHFNQATDDAPSFQTRIGLVTGEVLVGNIGMARHLSPYKTEQMVGQVRRWASRGSLVLAFLIFRRTSGQR